MLGHHWSRPARTGELQEETLLQIAGADAARLELLEQMGEVLDLLGRGVDILLKSEFVAKGVVVFGEKSVVVERTYEIGHHSRFFFCELEFSNLPIEVFVGSFFVGNLAFATSILSLLVVGFADVLRHIIEGAIIAQGIADGVGFSRLAAFALHLPTALFMLVHFKGFVVHQFVLQALFKIGQRHFEERREKHLCA